MHAESHPFAPVFAQVEALVLGHGWVGLGAWAFGALLALIALVRRSRATLLRRRRWRGG